MSFWQNAQKRPAFHTGLINIWNYFVNLMITIDITQVYESLNLFSDYDDYQQVAQNINLKRQALEAFQATLTLFQEQIDSRKAFEKQVYALLLLL